MSLLVFGHKNPDTDSICSSIALTYLKNQLGQDAVACALGTPQKEAQFVMDYFKVDAPKVIKDVKIQVKDLSYNKVETLNPKASILEAYHILDKLDSAKTLAVCDLDNKFMGIVTLKEVSHNILTQPFSKVTTSLSNIAKNLDGEIVVNCGDEISGEIKTLSFAFDKIKTTLTAGDIAIVGDRFDVIEHAINAKVQLLVLTGNTTLPENLVSLAKTNNVSIVCVELDTYKASNLLHQCSFIETITLKDDLCIFNENDYADDIKETMLNTNFRAYPVVNNNNEFLGLVSRGHLLNPTKKNVILVDHNEFGQSADGIEQANLVEVVDHHKLGGISSDSPMSFRVMPVGCTCTIIYSMFKEHNVEIPYNIAGVLLSAILSDTLLFKSPTTTELDKIVCNELSKIVDLDMESYAMEMFKVGTSLDEFSIEEIVNMDFKEFDMSGNKVGIGQVFTLDIDSVLAKKDEFLSYINSTDHDMLILAVTDIIKEGSYLIYRANDEIISKAFNVEACQGVFAPGVVSRKKQLVPNLTPVIRNS